MGAATLCGLAVETDDATGLARRVAAVRLGGRLGGDAADILGLMVPFLRSRGSRRAADESRLRFGL